MEKKDRKWKDFPFLKPKMERENQSYDMLQLFFYYYFPFFQKIIVVEI